ncbi:MAG: hypothetical protein HOW73_41135 [Polyangiaceae bacterium]|nr:hypothetical protein [Polyangiaceae bacterium]
MMRIPLVTRREGLVMSGARGYLRLGTDDPDVRLQGVGMLMLAETLEDEWACVVCTEKPAPASGPIKPYAMFTVGPYTFMLVPPTADGVGIPPDYDAMTSPKDSASTVPRLLVRSGYQRAIGRTFALHRHVATVGGALSNDVPLFRLPVPFVARLTRSAGELSYFVEVVSPISPGPRVRVSGPHGERNVLMPLHTLHINDWELALLPPTGRPT